MKLKTRITINFGTILIISGIIFNIAFRDILIKQMETTIKETQIQMMKSTQEDIRYRMNNNFSETDEGKLKEESEYLVQYINLNTNNNVSIKDADNNILAGNIEEKYNGKIEEVNKKLSDSNGIITINYSKNKAYTIMSYEIYGGNNEKVGTFNMWTDYSTLYKEASETISNITYIEIGVFICIFIIGFLTTTAVVKPISRLTEAVKKVEEGDFNFKLLTDKKDEVGILSREFVVMKDKIKSQIETINEEKKKVEALSNHRKQFFDNVTHEIKTPLTAITGYAEMLSSGMVIDEDFEKRALSRIHSESERVHKLVLDLIDVSKGLSQNKEDYKNVNIGNIINELIDDLQLKANKYNLKINGDIAEGVLFVQENRIRQLLINLIDNAIKYTSKSDIINVKTSVEGDKYRITIKNKTDIIPDEVKNSIFEPFVKINKETEKYSSGLGLYISKEIVDDNNGKIDVSIDEYFTVNIVFSNENVGIENEEE